MTQGSITQLRKTLANLYPDERDARRVAADAGLPLERIAFDAQAENNWFAILEEAGKHAGKVDALVAIARAEYPDESVLAQGGVAPGRPAAKAVILFLASNPATTQRLALDEEARRIEAMLRAAEQRDAWVLKTRWAVRFDDVQQALLEERPTVVHFSAHGEGAPGIVFNDDRGGANVVSDAALQLLFTALKDDIRVVVLNCCSSTKQAAAIAEVIDCVVGMNGSIDDLSAQTFAGAFYRGLGFGRTVKNAFDLGVVALAGGGLHDEDTPRLFVRRGVDASQLRLSSGAPALSAAAH